MTTFLIVLLVLSLMANWRLATWFQDLSKRDHRYYIQELPFRLKNLLRELDYDSFSDDGKGPNHHTKITHYRLIDEASRLALGETIQRMSVMRQHFPEGSSYMDEMNILGYLRLIGLREGQLFPEHEIIQNLVPFLPRFQQGYEIIEKAIKSFTEQGILCPEMTLTTAGANILYSKRTKYYWQITLVG